MKIPVVDDEQDICEILQFNLETEGYEVDTANSAEEAMMKPLENYDLIMLDVMMGEMSGFQMARKLKDNANTADLPIIFITALDDEDNTAKGLNLGGDDYISKPLSIKEVKARVRAVLRRTTQHNKQVDDDTDNNDNIVRYLGIEINDELKTVSVDGEVVALTKLEYELLLLLLRNPNRVFGRDEMLHLCWPKDVMVLNRTVDVNITRLRKKIGQYGDNIKTRIGYGYFFKE